MLGFLPPSGGAWARLLALRTNSSRPPVGTANGLSRPSGEAHGRQARRELRAVAGGHGRGPSPGRSAAPTPQ